MLLNVYHAYYFQVQVQLKFSDAQYCDFVVWNVDHLFVQRLCLDEPFITVALEKCKQFIKLAILPEILGKWYSREPLSLSDNETKSLIETNQDESQDLWCYCRKGESGTMIACENQECPIEWNVYNPKGKMVLSGLQEENEEKPQVIKLVINNNNYY